MKRRSALQLVGLGLATPELAYFKAHANELEVPTPPSWYRRSDLLGSRELFVRDFNSKHPSVHQPSKITCVGKVCSSTESSTGAPVGTQDEESWRKALDILVNAPKKPATPIDVLIYFESFSRAGPKGPGHRPFSEEWERPFFNPLLEFFYFEAGIKNYSKDVVPWCAASINWSMKQVGYDSLDTARAADFAMLLNKDESLKPERGDIVLFKKSGTNNIVHVNLFVQDLGDFVECIGGNQTLKEGGKVFRGFTSARFRKNGDKDLTVAGYGSMQSRVR